ncbi:hypothetical protein IFM89_014669 [Coptis chinensis]|uniref:Uncharacterized protein n=1 Tax=Coptis chinensis TaxID=261450 RepID=A0A835HMW4_9MAGN|nr:hypothetical protein IFM89_014669 [Coptis chinensis]
MLPSGIATIKLIGAIHKFIGPILKDFFSMLSPLLDALDLEYEKKSFEIRLESIDSVNKILEEANKRIQPTGTELIVVYCSCQGNPFSLGRPIHRGESTLIQEIADFTGDKQLRTGKGLFVYTDQISYSGVHLGLNQHDSLS